jgi:hypothetical protein
MKESKNKKRGRTRANGTGSIWTEPRSGKIYGVITFTTASGKRKRRARLAHSKTEAYQHIKDLRAEVDAELAVERANGGSFWIDPQTSALLRSLLKTLLDVLAQEPRAQTT